MERIKIAQLGIGHNHGEEKMKAFRKFPEIFDVVGVCEPDPVWLERRKDLPGYAGLPFMTQEELFAIPGLQAVSVETDVKDLDAAALACIQRGYHIHMDKPGGENFREFEHLMLLAKEKQRVVQMGYMYRYNPAIRYALDLAKDGRLGKIFEIDTQMSTCHPVAYRQWLQSFSCGTMYIFGCHLLDMIFQVLGPDYQKLTPYLRQTKPEEVALRDNALAVVEYPDAICTVRTTSVEVNGFGRRQLVICGTEGTVEVKPLEGPPTVTVSFAKDNPPTYQDTKQTVEVPPMTGRYDLMAQDFAAYIRGEKRNPFDHDYEIALQKATLQACGLPTD